MTVERASAVALRLTPDRTTHRTPTRAPMIKLTTNHGDILVELDADKAPATCANFEQYVRDGFYSSRGSAPAAAMATRTCPSQT